MKTMNIFWGIFWILVGAVILLNMLNVIDVDWRSVLRAWPFIIIFIGISFLPLSDMIKLLVLILTLMLMGAFVVLDSRCKGNYFFPRAQNFVNVTNSSNLYVDVEEENGITDLEIQAGAFELNLKYETSDPFVSLSYSDGISITPEKSSSFEERYRVLSVLEDCKMSLNSSKIWNIDAEFGAGGAYLDLRPFQVQKLEIKNGVSKMEIRIGDKSPQTTIEIKTGVGDAIIYVPKNSYCRLINEGSVFVNKDIEGFTKTTDKEFVTADTKGAKNEVTIYYTGAISNIRIVRD